MGTVGMLINLSLYLLETIHAIRYTFPTSPHTYTLSALHFQLRFCLYGCAIKEDKRPMTLLLRPVGSACAVQRGVKQ